MSTADIIAIASAIISGFAFLGSILALWISSKQEKAMQKQFSFEIITSCTTRFQEIVDMIDSSDQEEKKRGYRKYIDLCNEEIFYFQQKYILEEVMKEWLDGMLNYIPVYYKDEKTNLNKNLLSTNILEESDLLDRYPRIRNVFKVNKIYKRDNDEDIRKEIINNLLGNIRRSL